MTITTRVQAGVLALFVLVGGCAPLEQARPLRPLPNSASLAAAPGAADFVFYVFGDNRPKKAKDGPTPTIQAIAADLAAADPKPVLALSCGDLIEGKDPTQEATIRSEYQAIFSVLHSAGVPIFNAPGNHEMDDAQDVPNATMAAWYSQMVGLPYGSFDHGNSHFIALNTEEIAPPGVVRSPRAPTDEPSGTLDPGYISPAQRRWLAHDLAGSRKQANVFIFMHHSVHAHKAKNQLDAASAAAVQAIISQYPNVKAVFSAHEHLYYNPQAPDDLQDPMAGSAGSGPRYLVTGGAGAPLESGDHGFYHYLIVTVRGGDVTVRLVKLP